jgi:hypothetical protein
MSLKTLSHPLKKNKMHYIDALCEKLYCQSDDKNTIVKKILIQRGFICDIKNGEIIINKIASSESDINYFSKILTILNSKKFSDKDFNDLKNIKEFSRCVYNIMMPVNRMAGRKFIAQNSFFKTKWGARVDVKHLDPGVALLVKSLPMIATLTWESCDGHPWSKYDIHKSFKNTELKFTPCPMYIGFHDFYHAKWAEFVLNDIIFNMKINQIKIIYCYNYRLYFCIKPKACLNDFIERDLTVRKIAENLLNPEIHNMYRNIRPHCQSDWNQFIANWNQVQ